jgi:hypothetical protein
MVKVDNVQASALGIALLAVSAPCNMSYFVRGAATARRHVLSYYAGNVVTRGFKEQLSASMLRRLRFNGQAEI